jgi:uncharacterized SAM-binding protein YcdF (DUF218 family)
MTVLVGVLTALVISPLPFGAALIAAILLGVFGRKRASLWLAGATAAVLLAFSIGAVGSSLLRPLENRYPPFPDPAPQVDAVVVLGGGLEEGSPDEGGRSALEPTSLTRVVAGYDLARRLGVPVIVSGGRTWNEGGGVSEADVAARLLVRLGMPSAMVLREGQSTTTWENARRVAALIPSAGVRRVALVTSAWHMPRAMLAFERAGVSCVAAPAGFLSGERGLRARDLIPSFTSLRDSALALREYLGILAYAARR